MTELIGDICLPSEFQIPIRATADLPAAPKTGMIFYDTDAGVIKCWTGAAYEVITFTP